MLKHLNGWEMSKKVNRNWIFCKAFLRCKYKLHLRLHKTIFVKRSELYNPLCRNVGTSGLILDRTLTTSIVNLVCSMKGKKCDTSTSNIILRTDNKKSNWKSYELSTLLKKKLYKERTIYLIDNTNKVKASSTFISELSRILNWQLIKLMKALLLKMWTSDKANVEQSFVDCRRVLKSLNCNNLNKLVFEHLSEC